MRKSQVSGDSQATIFHVGWSHPPSWDFRSTQICRKNDTTSKQEMYQKMTKLKCKHRSAQKIYLSIAK